MIEYLATHRIETVSFVACVGLIAIVFELVRRKKIKEKYSFLWFVTGFSLLTLTFKRDWLTSLSNLIGVFYPPSALFLVLSFFVILTLIHYSIVISDLLTQNQKLAQKTALLESALEDLKKRVDHS